MDLPTACGRVYPPHPERAPEALGDRPPCLRIDSVVGSRFGVGAFLWLVATATLAIELRVAVASNFAVTLQELVEIFESQTGQEVTVVPGSTGKHYAQIRNGAPFDVFMAADARHPKQLEADGLAVAGIRMTYARGALVLWSPDETLIDDRGEVLTRGGFRFLGMANPDLAPYGAAAREVLEKLGLWRGLESRIVRGENIGQAFQFVATGAAELGFVALSQITEDGDRMTAGSHWRVPQNLYTPIDQQAVLLSDLPVAREFLGFLGSAEARAVIRRDGYAIAADETP